MHDKLPPEGVGVIMAIVIALLRQYAESERKTIIGRLVDACLCGALSFTAHAGIVAFGGDPGWSVFVGGSIGYFGPDVVKRLAIKFISNRS